MATADDRNNFVWSGSTVFFDNICQPCEFDGKILEAEGRCEDCDEYLCNACFLAHTVPFKMRHHVMTGKDQLDKDGIQDRKDQCTQRCSQHDGEIIKYYCSTHSTLGCNACMILNHTSCVGTIYIPDVAKYVLRSLEYSDYKARASAITISSQEITTDAKDRIETFNTCHTAAVEKLRSFKHKVIYLFEEAENKLIEDSEIVKQEEINKLTSILDKSTAVEKDVRALTSSVESYESMNQYCNMFVALMKSNEYLNACEEKLDEIEKRIDLHREIDFSPNHNIITEILSCRGIGKIKDAITQVTHEQDVNVKTESDTKTCWISSSVMLPDNRLVITDCENVKLKMIDTRQDKVVEELSMSSPPWDLTVTNSDEVAVTLDRQIAFVKIDKLVIHRNIDVDGKCRGVAYCEDTLVVTYEEPTKVEVMDMNGIVLRNIATDDTIKVKLKEPLFVVKNPVNNLIYISDAKGSKVVCLTSDDTLKSTYTDTDLGLPTGMTVDSFGNVYVCDWKKHSVHQITRDCKKKRILLTEEHLLTPYTISYCEAEAKLYVGMRDNDIVKVFKMT